jgi:hypothetical protein
VPIDALAATQQDVGPGEGTAASGAAHAVQSVSAVGGPLCIAERYTVLSSLGRGGMGEVFAAVDTRSGARIAVKVLHRTDASARGVERLLREANAAGRVQHPAVVRVFDAGVDEANGLAYIAQELLVGETLHALVARRGRLLPAEAVALLSPVVEALAAAHDVGVVHRDLKPENIFVERDGEVLRPRVIDFGIARLVARDDAQASQLTTTGAVLGTPLYMSPEQARGAADVDEQTDVWAIGIVLYELLTGATPFARATPHATLAAILLDPVVSPREAAPDVSGPLAAVVLRALARNRVERYGSMHELAEALRGASLASTAVAVPPPAPTESDPPPVLERPPPPAAPRRRVAGYVLGAVAVSALVAAVAGLRLVPAAPRPSPVPALTAVSTPVPASFASVDPAPVVPQPPPAEPLARPALPTVPDASVVAVPHVARPARRVQRASAVSPPVAEAVPARRINGAPIVGL